MGGGTPPLEIIVSKSLNSEARSAPTLFNFAGGLGFVGGAGAEVAWRSNMPAMDESFLGRGGTPPAGSGL